MRFLEEEEESLFVFTHEYLFISVDRLFVTVFLLAKICKTNIVNNKYY